MIWLELMAVILVGVAIMGAFSTHQDEVAEAEALARDLIAWKCNGPAVMMYECKFRIDEETWETNVKECLHHVQGKSKIKYSRGVGSTDVWPPAWLTEE